MDLHVSVSCYDPCHNFTLTGPFFFGMKLLNHLHQYKIFLFFFCKFRFQESIRRLATMPGIPFPLHFWEWFSHGQLRPAQVQIGYCYFTSPDLHLTSCARLVHKASKFALHQLCHHTHLAPGLPPCSGLLPFHSISPHCVWQPMPGLQDHFTGLH